MGSMRAIGADGCRAGWVVAAGDIDARGNPGAVTISVVPDFVSVAAHPAERIAVDMPIGLPELWSPGGRRCDAEARALLGPGRGASVFSAPPRTALALASWDDPRRAALGLTLQAWRILPRVREVDAVVTPQRQDPRDGARPVILEAHPELVFADLAGGSPVAASKHTAEGRLRRRVLLEAAYGRPIPVVVLQGAGEDDVLDALACLWVAAAPRGSLSFVPRDDATRDGRGLAMRIWRRDAPDARAPRDPIDEEALLDRVLEGIGPLPGIEVRRRTPGGAGGHRITLQGEHVRATVDADRRPGPERLAHLWAELREPGDGRRRLLIQLDRAKPGQGAEARARDWAFLLARMEEDLERAGRHRPDDWDAARLEWDPDVAGDVAASVAARLRATFGASPTGDRSA